MRKMQQLCSFLSYLTRSMNEASESQRLRHTEYNSGEDEREKTHPD